jgi:23S rRNA pseudouridine955/2504/2580 synthase
LNRRLRREGLKRMFLHARSLAFSHPISGEPVALQSPLPADLDEFRRRHVP